jgi:hypothetical protein
MCGRAWRKTAAGTTFEEFQSQTSAHIVNISFTPDGYGYFGCSVVVNDSETACT